MNELVVHSVFNVEKLSIYCLAEIRTYDDDGYLMRVVQKELALKNKIYFNNGKKSIKRIKKLKNMFMKDSAIMLANGINEKYYLIDEDTNDELTHKFTFTRN